MKKSLIALAVLGSLAGAASAQSSVTIYGIIDLGVSKLNKGTTAVNGLNANADLIGQKGQWSVRANTSSRLGFRGTEDLGGGMKANFLIEHRFAPDTGNLEAGATAMWHASSWVSLSGNFGEVRLGRQYVPNFYVGLAADPWGYDYNVAGAANFTRGAGNAAALAAGSPSRANNQVTYLTPNVSGFTAQVAVAAGEGAATGRHLGMNVMYAQGPLQAGFGYHDQDNATTLRSWNAMAAYDLGMIRPIVSYSVATINTLDITDFTIGATAPMGANGVLKLVYASMNPDGANNNTKKFGIGYQYNLSKRTSLHVDLGSGKTDGLTRLTGYEAGVKHVF